MTERGTRVVKTKWDGSVSAIDSAHALDVPGTSTVWLVRAGSTRQRPATGASEVVEGDELWVAVPGEWWVLCGHADADRALTGYTVHATAPFETPSVDGEIAWVDLDLDFEVKDDLVSLEDEAQFHDHARTMNYPSDVVRGAWSGIATVAARYTNGEWPFDGSVQDWLLNS